MGVLAEPPSPESPQDRRRTDRRWTLALSVLILGLAVHALVAVSGKSATYDEPIHALSNWLMVNEGGFRLTPDHPALWRFVVGLGLVGQHLNVDLDSPVARQVLARPELELPFATDVLYRSPLAGMGPLFGEQLIWRARIANSPFLILLAVIVARWAWVWGGRLAALIATLLLSLDPNFLAHGALVKDDVPASCIIALAIYCTWRLGQRLTWPRAIAFALSCTAAVDIKFSCVVLAPMLGLTLLYRALDSTPWLIRGVDGRAVAGRARRVATAIGVCTASLLFLLVAQWPVYDFREAPTVDGNFYQDRSVLDLHAFREIYRSRLGDADPLALSDRSIWEAVPGFRHSALVRALIWTENSHLLPQTWVFGLICAVAGSGARESFFLGHVRLFGTVAYFPVAILVKTPLATQVLVLMSVVFAVSRIRVRWSNCDFRWKCACLLIPPAVYLGIAMASGLNIGLRHVLPVYVPAFVGCGVVFSRIIRHGRRVRWIVPILLAGLAIETLSVFPNYLAFFNVACGGPRGGLALLGDSNLDWGQDLPALAHWYRDWRSKNATAPFYLRYFGTADPHAFGIDYTDTSVDSVVAKKGPSQATSDLAGPGVFAVSATLLQLARPPAPEYLFIETLRHRRPMAVINGSIYIFSLGTK